MKQGNILALTMVFAAAFSACEKSNDNCNLVAAKIIRYDCDRVIFQLLNTKMIGDADWQDVQTGQRYSNVVSYYNTCKIADLTKGEKITLYVSIKQGDSNSNNSGCIQCQALAPNPPQAKVDFAQISTSPCVE